MITEAASEAPAVFQVHAVALAHAHNAVAGAPSSRGSAHRA